MEREGKKIKQRGWQIGGNAVGEKNLPILSRWYLDRRDREAVRN